MCSPWRRVGKCAAVAAARRAFGGDRPATVLAGLLDGAGAVDPRPAVTPFEVGVLYATLLVVGVLLAVTLSTRG
ncbi:hypothetical protein BRC88_07835 [Halobacteriales archaeon QS_4_69_225]|nr:MAG: hypothetical protein BRC88_07835 [Halobacteriales archaeon QS_4_69_225]